MFGWKRVLILAPHTDDAELGCSGTIARLFGEAVVYVAISLNADHSLPKKAAKGILQQEFLNAMQVMGIPRRKFHISGFEVRKLNYHRQEILEKIVQLKNKSNPTPFSSLQARPSLRSPSCFF
jgi:LmbE family N-acetylglucosaminyl deacetylase